jgi:hypothetical protein
VVLQRSSSSPKEKQRSAIMLQATCIHDINQWRRSQLIQIPKEESFWSSSTIARGVLIKSRREAAIPKSEEEKKKKKTATYLRTRLLKASSKSAAVCHRRVISAQLKEKILRLLRL